MRYEIAANTCIVHFASMSCTTDVVSPVTTSNVLLIAKHARPGRTFRYEIITGQLSPGELAALDAVVNRLPAQQRCESVGNHERAMATYFYHTRAVACRRIGPKHVFTVGARVYLYHGVEKDRVKARELVAQCVEGLWSDAAILTEFQRAELLDKFDEATRRQREPTLPTDARAGLMRTATTAIGRAVAQDVGLSDSAHHLVGRYLLLAHATMTPDEQEQLMAIVERALAVSPRNAQQ